MCSEDIWGNVCIPSLSQIGLRAQNPTLAEQFWSNFGIPCLHGVSLWIYPAVKSLSLLVPVIENGHATTNNYILYKCGLPTLLQLFEKEPNLGLMVRFSSYIKNILLLCHMAMQRHAQMHASINTHKGHLQFWVWMVVESLGCLVFPSQFCERRPAP